MADPTPLRDRLLQAAVAELRERGADRFSLRATARRVGLDPAMVYREFRDKASLLDGVAQLAFMELATRADAAIAAAGGPTEHRLRALAHAYVRFALEHPEEFRVMFAGGRRGPLLTGQPSAFDRLAELLVELGHSDPLAEALLCWSSVHGLAWLSLDGGFEGYGPSQSEAIDLVIDQLVARVSFRL